MNRTGIQCFWLEETMRARRSLRRYGSGDNCPLPRGYHNAHTIIDEVDFTIRPLRDSGYLTSDYAGAEKPELFPDEDPRWPTHCACGARFEPGDRRQVFMDTLYRRIDNADVFALSEAEPGALWDAWWYGKSGFDANPNRPDSLHVMCRTPGGDWYVDGRSSQGRFWTRSGDPREKPPTITASPSIIAQSYHGWLRNGMLVPA